MPVISRAGLRFLIVFSIIGATGFSQLVIGRGYFGFRVTSTGVFMRSTPGAAPTVVSGHGAIQPDLLSTLPSTLAIFGLRQHGVLVSEGSVLNSGSFTGGRVFAEVNSTTNTGISLVSTRLQPQIQPTQTVVSFYFTDVEGITVRTGTLTLEANQQFTAFLNEPPFNGGNSLVGTFTFESSQSINAVAFRGFVNERSEFLLTALPIVPLDATTSASLVVPHFADGGGWRTRVVLVNPTNSAVNGKIEFLDHSGFVSAVADYAVTPRGSSNVQTDGIATETESGSVRITPGVPAFTIFSFKSNDVTVTEAGVPALAPSTAFKTYVENAPGIQSGLALANPSAAALSVNLTMSDFAATITIPGNGQRAFFLGELREFTKLPSPFQGLLKITSSAPIAVTSVRGHTNERGEFLITTTTPLDDSRPNPGSTFVPFFVDGGGYRTQFVLFGASGIGPSSGTLSLWNQDGVLTSIVVQ